ncbi:hypothetical protein COOONC_07543 [Cooperia oncophora]
MPVLTHYSPKRSLPRTLKFLKEEMGAVQMEFLNKVGGDSRSNWFPLLFGGSLEKIGRVGRPPEAPDWNNTTICNEWLDKHPYIVEEYRKKGYKCERNEIASEPGQPEVCTYLTGLLTGT